MPLGLISDVAVAGMYCPLYASMPLPAMVDIYCAWLAVKPSNKHSNKNSLPIPELRAVKKLPGTGDPALFCHTKEDANFLFIHSI